MKRLISIWVLAYILFLFLTKLHGIRKKSLVCYYYIEEVDIIKDLVTLKQASEIIGISYKTLHSWVSNNEVSYTKIGKRYYMTQEQLNALVFSYTKN